MKTKVLEKNVLNACCDYLALRKHFFWRNNNAPIYDPRFGGFHPLPKHTMKGIPDIIVITDGGYVVFLECKGSNGKLSPDQKIFRDRCKDKGAEYYVVFSVDQLKEIGL